MHDFFDFWTKIYPKIASGFLLFSLSFFSLYAQESTLKSTVFSENLVHGKDAEVILRDELMKEGMSAKLIEKLFRERAALIASGRRVEWTHFKRDDEHPVPFATCGDMGAENGWGSWQGATGRYIWAGGGSPSPLIFNAPAAPIAPRFNLTAGAGTDPCTPGGGGPVVPVVAPNFGNSSIQLGQPQVSGSPGGCSTPSTAGCAEQLIYPFTVTAQDTNFIYAYALVMENPGHSAFDQPFVRIGIYDSNGDSIPCGYFNYVAQAGLPGFFNSACAGALYKPWTVVGINVSAYIGQTLTIVITNADCSQGGHYAHSYWDFSCAILNTSPAAVCEGSQVTINAPTDPLIAYTYQWYVNGQPYTGPGNTSATITPYPSPNDTFLVTVSQPTGCDFNIMYVVDVYELDANFGLVNNCGTVAFSDSSVSVSAGNITNWDWTFPGGTPASSTAQNPSISFGAGTYTATLIVTSQLGCKDTMEKSFSIAEPAAAFTTIPVCVNTPMSFTDQSTGAGADILTSWGWDFGDGNSSAQQNPSHTYSVAGSYSVVLTVTTQAGCTDQITQTVQVNPAPTPGFSSTTVCFNNATVFTDLSGGPPNQWSWNFGDGNTSTQPAPSHTYSADGTYTVTQTVTNAFGCKDSIKLPVVVNPQPAANFTTQPVCLGGATSFSDASTVSSGNVNGWTWNFGDGNNSSQQNPSHTYTAAGTYSVSLTVTAPGGCSDVITQTVIVNPVPTAGFTASTVCFNNPTVFTDLSAGPATQWDWNFGDGNTSTLPSPSHTYSADGTYTVTQTVTNSFGCKDSIPLTVLVHPQPTANFTTPTVCFGATTFFTDSSTVSSGNVNGWSWDFGDGNSSTQQNPSHTYSGSGTYSVSLTVTAPGGCMDVITQTVVVNPVPIANFSTNIVCFNNPTIFTDLSGGNPTIWVWNFGDGNTTPIQNPTHIYSAPGTYTATLVVVNAQGCKDTIPQIVTVNPLPQAQFTAPPVCFGDTTFFTDQSTINNAALVSWSWNFADAASGAANTSSAQNPGHLFTAPGSYNVLLTVTSDSGCQSTTVVPIEVYPLPQAGVIPSSVCLNSASNFTDGSLFTPPDSINYWEWTFGDGSPMSNAQNPSHTYTAAGTYSISLLVVTVNGCRDSLDSTVTVYFPPVVAFSDSAEGCAPVCVTFNDLSTVPDGTISAWDWNFPNGGTPGSSSVSNPSVCWNQPGDYDVQLTVTSSNGCVDSLLIPQYINVYPLPKAEFCVTPLTTSYLDPTFNFCDQWTGGVVNWNWNFGDSTDLDSVNTDPVHNYSTMVTNNDYYSFIVTLAVQNQYGCWDTIRHSVDIIPEFVFHIPNAFSPNEDNLNDWFYGKSRGVKEYEIMIFDRWGNLIWECDYQGDNTAWDGNGQDGLSAYCQWDGKVQRGLSDKYVQEDVYVWKVRLTDIFDKKHNFIGKVTTVK